MVEVSPSCTTHHIKNLHSAQRLKSAVLPPASPKHSETICKAAGQQPIHTSSLPTSYLALFPFLKGHKGKKFQKTGDPPHSSSKQPSMSGQIIGG